MAFKWNSFPNILIIVSTEDINNYIVKDERTGPRILVNLHSGFNLNEFIVPNHVEKLWIKVQTRFPKNVSINARLEKLFITNQENLSNILFQKLNFWGNPKKGIYLFGFSKGQTVLPDVISDFENLTHLRINFSFINQLKDWVFFSPHIRKLLITEEQLSSPNEDFILDENKGIFLFRVRNDCRLPREEISMKGLTHLRINLSGLTELPNFLSNLTQFKQLLITSNKLTRLTGNFGTKDTIFRLELRVNNRCQMNESFGKLEKLTHLYIDSIALNAFPIGWKNLKDLSYIRLLNSRITKIPESISELKKLKYLHISFKTTQDFREDFWLNDEDNRLEINIPHNERLQYSNLLNLTHMRISGSRSRYYFDLTESNFNQITHIRIDNNSRVPDFIRECRNLSYLELNTEHLDQIPRYFMQFKKIQQLVITNKNIEFSEDFWETKNICTFKIKVNSNCQFPNFLTELPNLTHLWVELPDLRQLPEDLIMLQNENIRLRIIGIEELDYVTFEEYLKIPNPKFFIIIVNPNCNIPDSIENKEQN